MLKAIEQELSAHSDIQIVGTATHGNELHRLVRKSSPDVVILDLSMSSSPFEPITAIEAIRQTHPTVEFLVLTGYADGLWTRELIAAGARGYVLKSDDLSLCLPEGVRAVFRHERFYSPAVTEKYFLVKDTNLSTHDLTVLRLVAQGFSNNRIGQELSLSEKTVRNQLSGIYGKLGIQADTDINQRMTAINKVRDLGLLEE